MFVPLNSRSEYLQLRNSHKTYAKTPLLLYVLSFCFSVKVDTYDSVHSGGEQESIILVQTDANQRQSTFSLVNLLINHTTLLKDMIVAFSDPLILVSILCYCKLYIYREFMLHNMYYMYVLYNQI
jgi:hypothetical protein